MLHLNWNIKFSWLIVFCFTSVWFLFKPIFGIKLIYRISAAFYFQYLKLRKLYFDRKWITCILKLPTNSVHNLKLCGSPHNPHILKFYNRWKKAELMSFLRLAAFKKYKIFFWMYLLKICAIFAIVRKKSCIFGLYANDFSLAASYASTFSVSCKRCETKTKPTKNEGKNLKNNSDDKTKPKKNKKWINWKTPTTSRIRKL